MRKISIWVAAIAAVVSVAAIAPQAKAADNVKIGVLFPLTGNAGAAGQASDHRNESDETTFPPAEVLDLLPNREANGELARSVRPFVPVLRPYLGGVATIGAA